MTIHEANQQLLADLKQIGRDTEALFKAATGEAGEKMKEIRSRLVPALESAKTACAKFGEEVQERTIQTARSTDRLIRQHPYEAIGLGFGVGLFVGVLVGRR